jgi:diguanylate cyclase (GGDEF)-like protein
MVEVTELSRIDVVHSTDARPRWQSRQQGGNPGGQQPYHQPNPPSREVLDSHGIPHRELTPAVQRAIGNLVAELERERRDIDLAQERVSHLEKLSDRHSYMPVLNRRALYRELNKAGERAARTGLDSVFVLLHVRNVETVRRRFGRKAADAMLVFAADQLNDAVRATDTVGSVSDGDFGVILALAYEEGAMDKAREMVESLNRHRVTWQGVPLPFEATFVLVSIRAGAKAEVVVEAADKDLLRQEEIAFQDETRAPWEKKLGPVRQ